MLLIHAIKYLALVASLSLLSSIATAQDVALRSDLSASCSSVCLSGAVQKGVTGTLLARNLSLVSSAANVMMTAQVEYSTGSGFFPVSGASQSFGPLTVAPNAVASQIYNIAFTPSPQALSYRVTLTVTASNAAAAISRDPFRFQDCQDPICTFDNNDPGGCTLTQGYWKNHAQNWPVTVLTLGSVNYAQAELLAILNRPVKGNGLVSLAHQLIAAKLNVANGGTCATATADIAAADAMIGSLTVPPVNTSTSSLSTSSTSALVSKLDNFNRGLVAGCPGHCAE